MPSLTEIQQQILKIPGGKRILKMSEAQELPKILWEDEDVENVISGIYAGGNGVLVATNKRLVFAFKGVMRGLTVEDFPYDKISTIQYHTGMLLGEITIFTSGNKAEIKSVPKDHCRDFCEYVRARISAPKEHASAPNHLSANEDMICQLERIAKLKENGILTDEEFQMAKKKLLGI